ncbi:MAG: hypothetical protein HOV83_17335 [Catenulispora sp.]|nr:hypothetical protein [Catenulispora sp.]
MEVTRRERMLTPLFLVARLLTDPGVPPADFMIMTGQGTNMASIDSGDLLGIDGRWCPVVGCVSVNGHVSVETAYGYPRITAYWDLPIHLARKIDDLEGGRYRRP